VARDYCISASGDDGSAGTEAAPWRTLTRIREVRLAPGDRIRLDSRAPHRGGLVLRGQAGTSEAPIFVTSYGSERPAVILGGEGIAALLWNCSGIRVSRLHLIGAGFPRNRTHGLCLFADERSDAPDRRRGDFASYGTKYSDIVLEDLEIEGFGCAGLAIGGKADFGFRGVRARGVKSHDNAYAGILVWGSGTSEVHEDIVVDACEAFDNHGIPGLLHASGHGHHSGHGIFLSCVAGGSIENSRSYRNGGRSTAHVCGPAGIWASNSRRIVMRRNESFLNRTAGAADGGGFGFDGGMRDSRMEENVSRENDGAGFLMAQYYGARPFANNRFVGNTSLNDGRHNDYGAIHVWCPPEEIMSDLLIEGNQVQVSPSRRGRPRALFVNAVTENLTVRANSFRSDGLRLLLDVSPLQQRFTFAGNRIVGSGGVQWRGQVFEQVAGWLEAFPQ
jgi:hypothetical protein